jgi:hypothetical protein
MTLLLTITAIAWCCLGAALGLGAGLVLGRRDAIRRRDTEIRDLHYLHQLPAYGDD